MKSVLHLRVLLSIYQSNDKRNIKHIPLESHSTKYRISAPQNSLGHQSHERSEKLSWPRGFWGDTVTEAHVVPMWDPGAEKAREEKTKERQISYGY